MTRNLILILLAFLASQAEAQQLPGNGERIAFSFEPPVSGGVVVRILADANDYRDRVLIFRSPSDGRILKFFSKAGKNTFVQVPKGVWLFRERRGTKWNGGDFYDGRDFGNIESLIETEKLTTTQIKISPNDSEKTNKITCAEKDECWKILPKFRY